MCRRLLTWKIPNPNHRKDKTIDEQVIAEIKEIKPVFQQEPDRFVDWMQEAKRDLTPAQKRHFIKAHRHEAERPLDEKSRAYMNVLINLGAKDLDITNAVDEMLYYIDSGGDHYEIRALVSADTGLIIYNIHPKNFEQINRFLKASSQREPEILYEWQRFLIKQGTKKKTFREYAGFQWIKSSAFAEDPRSKDQIAKIATSS